MYTTRQIGNDPAHSMYALWEVLSPAGSHICTVIGEGDAILVTSLLNTLLTQGT